MVTSQIQDGEQTHRHWYAATFLFIAAFINLLDTTIVNLALPAIKSELSATDAQMQWVLVIYIIAFASGLLPFGRFGDMFGRRHLFLFGLLSFVGASMACGFAPDIEMLIFARLIKGLAGAMMLPQVLAVIHATFPDKDKGKAIGYFGMVSGLGALAGPLIGGPIISADIFSLGWRPIFLINFPLGLISIIGVLIFLPKISAKKGQSADWLGVLLFAGGLVALLYPLIEGQSHGWPVWMMALFAASAVFFTTFWRWQLHLKMLLRPQLLPIDLLKNRKFIFGIMTLTLLFIGVAGPIVVLVITLQTGLHHSPLSVGMILSMHPLSAMIASVLTGRLGASHLNVRVFLGVTSLLLGMVLMQSLITTQGNIFVLWLPLILIGAGIGAATVALFQQILMQVPPSDSGAGSGVLQTFQQVGIATGVALAGQIFFASASASKTPVFIITAFQQAMWLPITIYLLLCVTSALSLKGDEKS